MHFHAKLNREKMMFVFVRHLGEYLLGGEGTVEKVLK